MSWSKEFTWLLLDKEQSSMFCHLCKEFSKSADIESLFYLWTGTSQRSSIKTHMQPKAHPPQSTLIEKVAEMNRDNLEVLRNYAYEELP